MPVQNTYEYIANSKIWKVTIGKEDSAKVKFFYTDDASQFVAREHTWFMDSKGYVTCVCHGEKLHRLIMDAKEGDIVEFFNKEKQMITKRNLRKATRQEIRLKTKPRKKSFEIPIAGVEYKFGKWEARIKKDGYERYLGRFDNMYDAALCRIRNEYILFGVHSHNYRSLLKNTPRYYLLKWLPEIYSHMNKQFIGSEIYLAHYKNAKHTPPKLLKAVASIGKED